MRRSGPLIAAAFALAAAGCASLSGKQCRSGDWIAVGRDDGARGLPASEIERHRESCAAHGVMPDAVRYGTGHAEGLAQYCTPRGGYLAGRRADPYRKLCPAGVESRFLEAHRHGREVNVLLNEVKDLRRGVHDMETLALAGDYAPEDRTQMRFRADELNQRLRIREWDLERLDRRYARQYGAPELSWLETRD